MWLFSSCYGGRDEEKRADQDFLEGGQDHRPKHPSQNKAQPGNVKIVVPLEGLKEDETRKDVPVTECTSQDIDIAAHTFTFRELAAVTGDFTEDSLIGEGGFGCVYKGKLENGQLVAVKKLNRNGLQGNREFLVEVLMLSLLHHENLVNLIGYCADGEQRLLVYEYMPLGSLEDHLHEHTDDTEPLDWPTRMRIAAGAARGLEYLHETAKPPVIYRDLKSSNILLGDEFHPKLSDFGLAKLGPVGDKSHVSTRVMGTYGYCAPEYAMTGQLTMKSDIYSFGVVLLELITGRRAIDQSRPSGEHNLVAWARPLFKDRRKFALMADPNLRGNFPVRGLFQALAVAAMCLHEQAASRPAIADVVTALNFLASQTFPLQAPTPEPSEPSQNELDEQSAESTFPQTARVDDQQPSIGDGKSERRHTIWKAPMSSAEREKAVAEARIWGEGWREKRGVARLEKGGNEEAAPENYIA